MMKSNLPSKELGKIWKLADTDKDGMLDMEEFALAMHLIQVIFNRNSVAGVVLQTALLFIHSFIL